MARQSTGPERRRHRRVPAALPFKLLNDGKEEAFDLVDLSESGVRIKCRHAMPPMTRILVQLVLPGERIGARNDVKFETTGVVVWSHKAPEKTRPENARFDTGVFFADLDERQRSLLHAFVGSHS
jgi:hypothetical protein